jgi:hypothetical protein
VGVALAGRRDRTDIPTTQRRPGVYRRVLHESIAQAAMFVAITKSTIDVTGADGIGTIVTSDHRPDPSYRSGYVGSRRTPGAPAPRRRAMGRVAGPARAEVHRLLGAIASAAADLIGVAPAMAARRSEALGRGSVRRSWRPTRPGRHQPECRSRRRTAARAAGDRSHPAG